MIYDMIGQDIFDCSWVATRCQLFSRHIHTQTIQETSQNKQCIEQHKLHRTIQQLGRLRAVPRLCGFYHGIYTKIVVRLWLYLAEFFLIIRNVLDTIVQVVGKRIHLSGFFIYPTECTSRLFQIKTHIRIYIKMPLHVSVNPSSGSLLPCSNLPDDGLLTETCKSILM